MFRSIALATTAVALALAPAAAADVDAHGSVQQVYVTGLTPGAKATLVDAAGKGVKSRKADSLGGLLFRNVRPGGGYRVRLAGGGATSQAVTVLPNRSAPPIGDVYNQSIPPDGYGYLTTRDGPKLANSCHLPQDI